MGKQNAEFSHFSALDMRVGRIISVDESKTNKPTYKITVDFGDEIGKRTTIGAFKNYPKEELIGRLVIGLVNVGEKRMGEEVSQFLLMGVPNEKHETIYITPQADVPLGVAVF
jgi:tRNA-binding protein